MNSKMNNKTTEAAVEITEEIKKNAMEKVAQVKIYQLFLIAEVINLASTRGAFKGSEKVARHSNPK